MELWGTMCISVLRNGGCAKLWILPYLIRILHMPLQNRFAFFNSKMTVIVVVLVLIGFAFWVGRSNGYTTGYAKAQDDVKALQEEATQKATEDAAKSANPFQAVNPLEGVEANPFEKVKKVLNPFEN